MKKKIFLYILLAITLISLILVGAYIYSKPWDRAFFLKPITTIQSEENVIALTFDDGPSETRTPALLDLLEKYNVKATFFMIGENIEKYPDIAKEVYNRGHLIGNHSYSHPRFFFKTPTFTKNQIQKTDQLIKGLGQEKVNYFRPPYSFSMVILPLVLNKMDKELVNGTYDPPAQYQDPFDSQKVANQVLENVKPGDIIYLHDGNQSYSDEFVECVEIIIKQLQSERYMFVTIN